MIEFLIERGHSWSEIKFYPMPLITTFFWAAVRMEEMKSRKRSLEGALSSRGVLPSSVNDPKKQPHLASSQSKGEVSRLKNDMKTFTAGRKK